MALDNHDFDEDGMHEPDECELCIERTCSVTSECRCGHCCERLILEATLRDGEREPRIAAECPSIREIGPDPIGYLLNARSNNMACHFFDQERRLCTIYETRPLMCRVFNCDVERRSGVNADLLRDKPKAE